MWILPNHDSRLEKKDAKNILKGKVFRQSKPMSSRSVSHYLNKRGKFLSSKIGMYQSTALVRTLKNGSRKPKSTLDWHSTSVEDWEQFTAFLRIEYSIRRKVNTDTKRVLWGTALNRDHHDATLKRELPIRKDGCHRLDIMVRQVMYIEKYRGIYNARWVETAMGLPVGWVKARD